MEKKIILNKMNKKIFWDMDYTLGSFDQIAYELSGIKVPEYLPPFGIREGIERELKKLIFEGYTNYVTTSATRDYASKVLNGTGLDKYFIKINYREDIDGYYSPKNYRKILDELNISDNGAGDNILIIGDKETDVPYNISTIVTILDSSHYLRDASLTKTMIDMLKDNGNGSFNKGFQKLYSESELFPPQYSHLKSVGRVVIDNDVELRLKFMQTRENYSNAPIFEVRSADKYLSKKTKKYPYYN